MDGTEKQLAHLATQVRQKEADIRWIYRELEKLQKRVRQLEDKVQ